MRTTKDGPVRTVAASVVPNEAARDSLVDSASRGATGTVHGRALHFSEELSTAHEEIDSLRREIALAKEERRELMAAHEAVLAEITGLIDPRKSVLSGLARGLVWAKLKDHLPQQTQIQYGGDYEAKT